MLGVTIVGRAFSSTTTIGDAEHVWRNGQELVALLVLLTAVDGRRVRRHLHRRADPASTAMSSEPAPFLFFFAVDGADDARGRVVRPAAYMDATSLKEVRHA
jgi:hypothetical protein